MYTFGFDLGVKVQGHHRGPLLDMTLRLIGASPGPTFEMTLRDRGQSRVTDIRIRPLHRLHFSQ